MTPPPLAKKIFEVKYRKKWPLKENINYDIFVTLFDLLCELINTSNFFTKLRWNALSMYIAFVCILNLLFKNTDRSDFVLTDRKLNIYEWIQ